MSAGRTFSYIADPLDLFGSRSADDAANAEAEAQRKRDMVYRDLVMEMPTQGEISYDQLTGFYGDQYTPELAKVFADEGLVGQQNQALGEIADPASVAAQRDALSAMQDVYRSGGMTAADTARLRLGQAEQAQFARGQQQALQQNMAERGMGGSGSELAALLSNQQGMQQGLMSQNAQMQIEAQRRAIEAMRTSGAMAGQMRGQQMQGAGMRGQMAGDMRAQGYREAASRAQAQDARMMYNREIDNERVRSRADAARDIYGMHERRSALLSGQYQGDADRARQDRQAAQSQRQETAKGVVDIIL